MTLSLDENIINKFEKLIGEGDKLAYSVSPGDYWLSARDTISAQAWISSSSYLIQSLTPINSFFRKSLDEILKDRDYLAGSNIPCHTIQKVLGVLTSVYEEYQTGTLKEYEYIIAATAFDDFLDHAEQFHKAGKKEESSILASIVFEDSLKKIAQKNSCDVKGKSLEDVIQTMQDAGVFNPVKAKRLKGHGVRNHALHAEWDDFDIRDVGEFIKDVKNLISDYL